MEDVIRGIHQVCGDTFPIDVRISPRHYMKAPLTSVLPGEEYKEYGRDIDETIKEVFGDTADFEDFLKKQEGEDDN